MRLWAFGLLLTMVGCDSLPVIGEAREIVGAKKAVSLLLKDPESAQWRNVRKGTADTICGEVNARNSYGGYTGFKRFMIYLGEARIEKDPEGIDPVVDKLEAAMFPYDIYCKT